MWILNIVSESGDTHFPHLIKSKPKDENFKKWLKKYYSDDFPDENGPGIFGSYLYAIWTYRNEIDIDTLMEEIS